MRSSSRSSPGCASAGRRSRPRRAAATPPARLHGVDDPLHRLLLERSAPDLERIAVGDQASLARARSWLAEWQPGMTPRLASVPDPFEATGAAEQLEAALQPTVPLAGGGSLIIQPTAALTAIDVNGGGRQALEANLAAAHEIARQLRLRRIGGTTVVDFIDLPTRTARARVLAALREAVADDPAPVQVFPMSRFGLVEISRRRMGPSLAEMLGRPCPWCEGDGTLPALRWRAEQLIASIGRAAARKGDGPRRTRPARLSEREGRLGGGCQPGMALRCGAIRPLPLAITGSRSCRERTSIEATSSRPGVAEGATLPDLRPAARAALPAVLLGALSRRRSRALVRRGLPGARGRARLRRGRGRGQRAGQAVNAWIPVWARPRIRAWMSWVPS